MGFAPSFCQRLRIHSLQPGLSQLRTIARDSKHWGPVQSNSTTSKRARTIRGRTSSNDWEWKGARKRESERLREVA